MGAGGSKEDDRGEVWGQSGVDEASRAALMLSPQAHLTSLLQLRIRAEGLQNMDAGGDNLSDPFCVAYISEGRGKPWVEVGRTEIVANSLSPRWVSFINLMYRFEETQVLKVKIYDADEDFESPNASHGMDLSKQDFQGEAEVPLAMVVGGRGQSWTGPLSRGKGTVTLNVEEVPDSNASVTMLLRARNLPRPGLIRSPNPFIFVSRVQEDGTQVPCMKTEVRMSSYDAGWSIDAPLATLAAGDLHRPLTLDVVSWSSNGKHVLLGSAQCSLSDLISGRTFNLEGGREKGGSLSASNGLVHRNPSFFDFLAGGLSLSFQVAIDFTASNGDSAAIDSLHYHRPPHHPSPYARALAAVGNVIEFYDKTKNMPVWGFGGKPPFQNEVSHCFPLNGSEANPYAPGIHGILDLYERTVAGVTLSGPTLFAPVVSQAGSVAASMKSMGAGLHYTILLIITDGLICDMQNCVDAIVASAEMPLSIIIVGVGQADFSSMDTLDGDDVRLVSSRGQKAKRDIVQFVPFEEFAGDMDALAREVLQELPGQVTEYMKMHNVLPGPATLVPKGSSLRDVLVKQQSNFRASQQNLNGTADAPPPPPPYAPR